MPLLALVVFELGEKRFEFLIDSCMRVPEADFDPFTPGLCDVQKDEVLTSRSQSVVVRIRSGLEPYGLTLPTWVRRRCTKGLCETRYGRGLFLNVVHVCVELAQRLVT